MQPPPLKPRSPPKGPHRLEPLLPRSLSNPTLNRMQAASDSMLDRLGRHRPMRNTLLMLLSLVLAANCVWLLQGVTAWRRGLPMSDADGQQQLLLKRLNSTTLSVEVSRVGSPEGEGHSTFLLNAQVVDANVTNGQTGRSQGGNNAQEAAAAARVDALLKAAQERPTDLVSQLKDMGSALGGALAAATDSVLSSMAGGGVPSGGGKFDHGSDAAEAEAAAATAAATKAAAAAEATRAQAKAEEEQPKKEDPPPPPEPHRAVLKLPEVAGSSSDACAQVLRLPKVALLFLTRGDLHHHQVWQRWFEVARDQLPAAQLSAALCESTQTPPPSPKVELVVGGRRRLHQDGQAKEAATGQQVEGQEALVRPELVAEACGWNATSGHPLHGAAAINSSSVIEQQHLFSVYIHAPPNITDGDLPDLFRGRLITDRLQPEWGTHQLVEATRNLLWEAFRDPLNERFVLLSESDIPLYDPLTFHQQLLAESKSRINLCRHAAPTDTRRWTWRMTSATLKSWHWRKSSQWFGLQRRHVEVVLQDVEVYRRFEEFCNNGWDGDYKRWRDCFSDEHYIPTLLASKRLDDESSCHIDGIVSVDWSAGGPHPKSYRSWEVRPSLVHKARGQDRGCDANAAIADAPRMFVSKAAAFGGPDTSPGSAATAAGGTSADMASPAWQRHLCRSALPSPLPSFAHPLSEACSMTARKFTKPTVRAVSRLFTDCSNGLDLLAGVNCTRA